jgi:hypothetical protein
MPDELFKRDASGRLAFVMSRIPMNSYPALCNAIAAEFRIIPQATPVTNSCDIIFQDFGRGDQVVGLEWDNWSGFIITAKTPPSESLVREIAAWLLQSQWVTMPNAAHRH